MWKRELAKWGAANQKTKFLATYVPVRWYSFVTMLDRAESFKGGFVYLKSPDYPERLPAQICLQRIKPLLTLLKPFAEAISNLERKEAKLGEVWVNIVGLQKHLVGGNHLHCPVSSFQVGYSILPR